MDNGHFYFVDDQYFIDFPDNKLMKNKEILNGKTHGRPCFYAFLDSKSGLYWMIPISSQVSKFKVIYARKIKRYHSCDTIVFGEVLGHEKAFLIQNMFPISQKYISSEYVNGPSNVPVRISGPFEKNLVNKAKRVLALHRQNRNLIFPDVLSIEAKLIS